MNIDGSQPDRPAILKAIAVGLPCGAAIGVALGLVLVPTEVQGREIVISAFAATGALWTGAVATRIVRTTGWTIIAGAILGGIIAVLANGHGKAAIYGVPIGFVVGLVAGLAIENRLKQSRDKTA